MSALMNQARSRVPRIAEAAVERARLTVVPAARPARGARPGAVRDAGVAAARRRRRRAAVLQHLDAAGSFTATAHGGPGRGARRAAAGAADGARRAARPAAGGARRPSDMGMVPPTSPAFLELSDGKVLGKATPAASADALRDHPAADPQAEEPAPDADRDREGAEPGPTGTATAIRDPPTAARHPGPTRSTAGRKKAHDAAQQGSHALTHGSRPPPPAAASASRAAGRPRAPDDARRGHGRCAGASLVRLRIGFLLIAMIVSVFAARLFQLQGVDAQAYVAKARAEGVVTVTLPANRGAITDRNGVPLAESVDGLMIVADPTLTVKHASEIATIIARRLGRRLLRRARSGCASPTRTSSTSPGGSRRPRPGPSSPRSTPAATRASTPGATRCGPTRATTSRANLVGFMNAEGDAGRGRRADVRHAARPARTARATYEMGGGNRIPLGDNSTVPPRSGHDLKLTIDRDVQWYTQRVRPRRRPGLRRQLRLGRRDGHPHRASCSALGRLPDVRRQPADPVAQERTSAPARCATSTSPARWRRC